MTCDTVLAILFETDLESLRAGDHPGGAHVARCPDCRRAADRILEGEDVLDGWLGAAPRPDTWAILAGAEGARGASPAARAEATGAAANATAEARAGGAVPEAEAVGAPPPRRAARVGAWIALAAAAMAAVFLGGDLGPRAGPDSLDRPPTTDGPAAPAAPPRVALGGDDSPGRLATPEIEVPAGRNAAILRTDDPDITIIWFYGGD